ncbi:MAG: cytochrome c3 family protein [Pyrinomonadaceae bacterium]
MNCNTCHKFPSENWQKVRTGSDAFPDITDYPRHESCVNCHKQQFFKGAKPAICSVCHTNPSPRNSTRHPFPNPREIFDKSPKGKKAESDFVVGFPHDKHIEIVSINSGRRGAYVNASLVREDRRRAGEESCSVCHQTYMPQGDSQEEYFTVPPPKLGDAFWLKKGTFKTAPIGHTTCFTCHSADTGILPAAESCAACHHLKPPQPKADFDEKTAAAMKIDDKRMMDSWRRRDSSGKFQHSFVAHVDMDCSTCHNVLTINTADPLTKRVSFSSCATCHATATSDDGGALNFEVDSRKANAAFQCVKCHITFGKLPIPESHLAAMTAAGK